MHSFKTLPNRIYTVHMVSLFGEPAFPERLKKKKKKTTLKLKCMMLKLLINKKIHFV